MTHQKEPREMYPCTNHCRATTTIWSLIQKKIKLFTLDRVILILWKCNTIWLEFWLGVLKKQRQSFCLLYFFSMQTLTATVWAAQTTTKWLGALEAICGDGPRRHRRWCSIRYLWAHLSYPWVYLLSRPTRTLSLYTNCKCNLDFQS